MLYQRRYRKSVQSLQEGATGKIISQLGQVAEGINSRFTCGGKYEVPPSKPIELAYRQNGLISSKEWSSVEFPGVSEADMIKLLEVCSVASYGYKGEDVVDKNYRNAFKLEPNCFITSFQLCSTPILQEIQSIVPTVVGLRAELYKLNIYAHGGFFKAHVDTPRSEKMFGSLVVCLPTQFTGGELIVRHHKEEIKYDWSSTASDTSSTLHWVAFFSDVEHEVLPVSEGYRVTLTYNLSYQFKASDATFDVKTCSFYKLLQAALSNPVFMRDGGVLGFNSQHSYVFDTQWADLLAHINTIEDKDDTIGSLNRKVSYSKFAQLSKEEQVKVFKDAGIEEVDCKQVLDALPLDFPLLKGGDYIVFESAKSLGLPVCVKPFLSNNRQDIDFRSGQALDPFDYAFKDFSQHLFEEDCLGYLDGDHRVEPLELFGSAICRYKSQDITWCQKLSFQQPAGAALHYGNNASVDLWYKSVAILIRVPKWSEYRQRLIALSIAEYRSTTEASGKDDDDGMINNFEDIFQDHGCIIEEETRKLNDQFKQLMDNKSINKVEGLVDMLKEMQKKLNDRTFHLSQRVDNIYRIRGDLEGLQYNVECKYYSVEDLRQSLLRTLGRLRHDYRSYW